MAKNGYRTKSAKARMHGAYVIERELTEKGDDAIKADDPIGSAVMQFVAVVISDLGGEDELTGAHRQLLEAVKGDAFIVATLDAYIGELGKGIINRRHRKPYPILEARGKYADRLQRRLESLYSDTFKRKPKPVPDLKDYIEANK